MNFSHLCSAIDRDSANVYCKIIFAMLVKSNVSFETAAQYLRRDFSYNISAYIDYRDNVINSVIVVRQTLRVCRYCG